MRQARPPWRFSKSVNLLFCPVDSLFWKLKPETLDVNLDIRRITTISLPQTVPPPPHCYPHSASRSSRPRGFSFIAPRPGDPEGRTHIRRLTVGYQRPAEELLLSLAGVWTFPVSGGLLCLGGKLRRRRSLLLAFFFFSSCRMKELPHRLPLRQVGPVSEETPGRQT